MSFRAVRVACGLLLSILVSAPAVFSQQISTPQAQQPLKVSVEMVHLYATVRDKHGGLVADLTKDDFRVFEDGKPQKIAYFNREMNQPLTLAILVDTSGSQERILPEEQSTAKQFLKEILTPKDLALVITFDTDVNLLADFTSTRSILDDAIDRARINAAGPPPLISNGPFPTGGKIIGTDFYDAVYLASHRLENQAGRKAIIALTDAQDYGSQETMDDAIDAAQHADTVIHVLLTVDRGFYGFADYRGDAVAERMARETGGRVIRVSSGRDLDKAFATLSQEMRSQYVIGYYPTNAARDGTFRKIKVETTDKHDHVLTRSGYYAPTQ